MPRGIILAILMTLFLLLIFLVSIASDVVAAAELQRLSLATATNSLFGQRSLATVQG